MLIINKFINWFLKKGGINMVDMYVALVIADRRTADINNTSLPLVPERYRATVLADLLAIGLDGNGDPIE